MATSTKRDQQSREARARLRTEREAAARKATLRGRLLVGGALAAVLALAAGIGIYASKPGIPGGAGDAGASSDSVGKPFVRPAHTSGTDGVVVPYGKADAKDVVSIWIDPRCPFCAGVETGLGPTLKEQADAGTYRVDYHFATFLDGSFGGKGSKRALNALGAAVNESPERFMDYLQVLYKNHPAKETDDTFGSTATLLDLADQVPGLRTPAFNQSVKELTYMPWVDKVSKAFHESGKTGTPDIEINGKRVNVLSGKGIDSIAPESFKRLVADNLKK
ncbi:thioredoxin domain-containing protein [Streptomyces sp. G-G2]|uniref:thioredoxin domain-containing protein n=1 Tax=Streptomyces sp. G-G2 TaxID=3046201 RepID=UPI0024BA8A96|nr:thioredoxin domain-containing protein [Streptomyces sp. G-G2]MDJ0381450.1 thioredoxin domain-containing protein [Streptomyces sp. G-G2]